MIKHIDSISIDPRQDTPLAQQIKQQLTWLIANGQVSAGETLTSVRRLAARLGVNVNTVRAAYMKLEAEGLVETRQGRGTTVLPFDIARFAKASGELRSHTIGVILPSWSNPFYHAFLHGVEEIAGQDQSLIFLCNSHDDPGNAWRDFARLSAKGADGVLIVSHDITRALMTTGTPINEYLGTPFVTVDWPGCEGYSVQMDLESAGYDATRHLIEHGHQRIGLLTFEVKAANIEPVNAGYRRALLENGFIVDPSLESRVPSFDIPAGEVGARRLLELPEPPTAIFAIADTLALGAIWAIKDKGLNIPGDVAIASFNDIPAASIVDPGLTSVSAPAYQMGVEAMKMLRARIEGRKPPLQVVTLPTQLVIRQSCGCLREISK
jgi:DNA-binding LacI/PurR family transcriptional regulator